MRRRVQFATSRICPALSRLTRKADQEARRVTLRVLLVPFVVGVPRVCAREKMLSFLSACQTRPKQERLPPEPL